MKVAMRYMWLVLVGMVEASPLVAAIAVGLHDVDSARSDTSLDSGGSARSVDSERSLQSPSLPKTPRNSPRDEKMAVKVSVLNEQLSAKMVGLFRTQLQQGLEVLKQGLLAAPSLAEKDEELYPLHWAVRHNDPDKLAELLASGDCDVNERDSWGATALYWAAISAGAGRGGPENDGKEAAISDADQGQEPRSDIEDQFTQNTLTCFDRLLQAGADPNICTRALTLYDDGVRKIGGDSIAHVIFALYNVGEIRLTTWVGYLRRLIVHNADLSIKNHAGLKPLDMVTKALRKDIEKIVEEQLQREEQRKQILSEIAKQLNEDARRDEMVDDTEACYHVNLRFRLREIIEGGGLGMPA